MFRNLKRKYIKYKMNQMFQEFIESLENRIDILNYNFRTIYDEHCNFIKNTNYSDSLKNTSKYGVSYSLYLKLKNLEYENRFKQLNDETGIYLCKLYDTRIIYYNWAKEFDTREFKFNEVLQIISKYKRFKKYNILSLDWMKIV